MDKEIKPIPKIVITGGSGAGKTTVLKKIKDQFASQGVLVIPEMASGLFNLGFPMPGRDISWSREWQDLFEEANFSLQLKVEKSYDILAVEKGAKVAVCDRGLMDCAAYLKDGVDGLCRLIGMTESEIYQRYVKVIHMESLATANSKLYEELIANDQNHYHPLEEAIDLEMRTRMVWQKHPGWTFVPGSEGIDRSIKIVLDEVKLAAI